MELFVISGTLGRRPELQVTQNGKAYTRMSVAVDRWDSREKKKVTQWYNVTVWNELAERCDRYLDKGSKVVCEGLPEFRAYKDRNGEPACSAAMTAFRVEFMSKIVDHLKDDEPEHVDVDDAFNPYAGEPEVGEEVQAGGK